MDFETTTTEGQSSTSYFVPVIVGAVVLSILFVLCIIWCVLQLCKGTSRKKVNLREDARKKVRSKTKSSIEQESLLNSDALQQPRVNLENQESIRQKELFLVTGPVPNKYSSNTEGHSQQALRQHAENVQVPNSSRLRQPQAVKSSGTENPVGIELLDNLLSSTSTSSSTPKSLYLPLAGGITSSLDEFPPPPTRLAPVKTKLPTGPPPPTLPWLGVPEKPKLTPVKYPKTTYSHKLSTTSGKLSPKLKEMAKGAKGLNSPKTYVSSTLSKQTGQMKKYSTAIGKGKQQSSQLGRDRPALQSMGELAPYPLIYIETREFLGTVMIANALSYGLNHTTFQHHRYHFC